MAVTINGTTGITTPDVDSTADISANGLTVGRGAGAVSTNTAVGASALAANTTGANNIALGFQAGDAITTGALNTAVGSTALSAATTASNNTAVGAFALDAATGSGNTGIGSGALGASGNTADNNTAVGFDALNSNTANANTAVGYRAAYSNTTGFNIVAIGAQALNSNTTGAYNCSVGGYGLYFNTTGINNTAIGAPSSANSGDPVLYSNTTGSQNIGIGPAAMFSNTTGSNNIGIGYRALYSNTTASNNTVVGHEAGASTSTGLENTFVGYIAGGSTNTTRAVCLGNAAGFNLVASNQLYIARDNVAGGNAGCWIFGASTGACTQGNNSSSWTTVSDERLKNVLGDSSKGLAEVMQIEVKNFKYKPVDELPDFVFNDAGVAVISPNSENVYTGPIAQQVQAPFPESIKVDEYGVLTVDSDPIFWAMLKAIQELKAEFDAYKASHP